MTASERSSKRVGLASAAGLILAMGVGVAGANAQGFGAVDPGVVSFGEMDIEALRENARARQLNGKPRRFAQRNDVALSPATSGTVERLPDGRVVWRLAVETENAMSVNIGALYDVPPSTRLYVLDENGDAPFGAFTAEHNADHGQLWTPVVGGPVAYIEAEVDADEFQAFAEGFQIFSVNLGFDGIRRAEAIIGGGGQASCHVDVACDEADPWRNEVNSVGAYTVSGTDVCSGALMNTTARDGRPYFMTAFHCLDGVSDFFIDSSMVVYWNYQNSTCRTPGSSASGQPGDATPNQFSTAGDVLMRHQFSDWVLIELDSEPPDSFNVTYAGWDRRSGSNTRGAGIHHPGVEEKRISIERSSPVARVEFFGGLGNVTTWRVQWDEGGVEGGSSGSPFFNNERLVIGTATAASFPTICFGQLTWYGRLDVAWDGGGTSSTRLSDWLDPINTGELFVESSPSTTIPPGEFDLVSPADGASDVEIPLTLSWDASDLADEYFVTVFDLDDFGLAFAASVDETSVVLDETDLDPGTNYEWNVQAVNDAGDFTSETFTFSTEPLPVPPGEFAILTPGPGASVSLPLTISWEASENADDYRVLIIDADNPSVKLNQVVTETSIEVGEDVLDAGVNYNLEVIAQNEDGSSSATSSFTTTEPTCGEDLTGDGFIGAADLLQVLGNYGGGGAGDVDGDGSTGASDLLSVLGLFGQTC